MQEGENSQRQQPQECGTSGGPAPMVAWEKVAKRRVCHFGYKFDYAVRSTGGGGWGSRAEGDAPPLYGKSLPSSPALKYPCWMPPALCLAAEFCSAVPGPCACPLCPTLTHPCAALQSRSFSASLGPLPPLLASMAERISSRADVGVQVDQVSQGRAGTVVDSMVCISNITCTVCPGALNQSKMLPAVEQVTCAFAFLGPALYATLSRCATSCPLHCNAVSRAHPASLSCTDLHSMPQITANEYPPGVGLAAHIDTHCAFTGQC